MNARLNLALLAALLSAGLAACSSASPAAVPVGGRPGLPTGAEVRHPAAPAGAYLNLLSDAGESFYQVSVKAGDTVTTVDPAKWRGKETGKTGPVAGLVPAGATSVVVSDAAQVLTLHWIMWQDSNSNGAREDSEVLPLMSHDRAVYADKAVTVEFKTATPDMQQHWTLAAGWSRAAHFVYLPSGSSTYRRSLSTDLVQHYELHVPTPSTSQRLFGKSVTVM